MKKVKIIWPPKTGCYAQMVSGNREYLSLAWIGRSTKDVDFPVISNFTSCREGLIAALWKILIPRDSKDGWNYTIMYNQKMSIEELLTTTRARILVREVSMLSDPVDAFATRALRVLNIFEKYLGWRSTKIYASAEKCPATISRECIHNIKANDYVFEFSRKWIRSPELLSLYLMIVKMCQFNIWNTFKSVNDLQKVAALANRIEKSYDIIPYFTRTHQFFIPVLDSINELFAWRPMKNNYETYDGVCGFHVLVESTSTKSEMGKRWAGIRKKLKLKRINYNGM